MYYGKSNIRMIFLNCKRGQTSVKPAMPRRKKLRISRGKSFNEVHLRVTFNQKNKSQAETPNSPNCNHSNITYRPTRWYES